MESPDRGDPASSSSGAACATGVDASSRSPWRDQLSHQHQSDGISSNNTLVRSKGDPVQIRLDSLQQQRRQPSPSFPGSSGLNNLGGTVPIQPGEDSFFNQERPTSAPPPPGFTSDGVGERTRIAEELLSEYQQQHPTSSSSSSHQQNFNIPAAASSSASSQQQQQQQQQSNAFSNLASVLGAGLAESMMWNNNGNSHHNANNSGVGGSGSVGVGDDALNWHRQTRHAASRLLGASPPKHALLLSSTTASSNSSGFPSALSTPHRPSDLVVQRATTPVELTAGTRLKRSTNNHQIGMNVVEPEALNEFSGLSSFVTSHNYGGGGGGGATSVTTAQSKVSSSKLSENFLWSPTAPEFVPYDDAATTTGLSVDSGGGASQTDMSAQQAEAEIYPFLWDIDRNKPSRTICILRVSWLRAPDVRNACEAYGVLDSFRADFSSRGIYFCSYYDIRSAQYAAVELQAVLQRMLVLQRSSEEVIVRYCLALSSSSQFDESQLCLSDLPPQVDENHLANMLSSYGAVRSVYPHGPGAFLVEFYSVQDAKQALLELDSSQPWGPHVNIETGVRNPVERKRGRELLATLSRWRQQMGLSGSAGATPAVGAGGAAVGHAARPPNPQLQTIDSDPWGVRNSNISAAGIDTLSPLMTPLDSTAFGTTVGGGGGGGGGGNVFGRQSGTPQLVLGPDGRYQVVMPAQAPSFGGRAAIQQAQAQQIVQGPNGQLYVIPVQNTFQVPQQIQRLGSFQQQQQQQQQQGNNFDRRQFGGGTGMPFYTHVVATSDAASLGSGLSYRSSTSASEDKDNRHLMLDLEAVENGIDTRTSLMVRNIPNKYTQQMLLAEFEEHGHGPGVIDFFYLPIDFKNRCNRGYAFINFVDYKDILMFHRRYFGKHWRTFNSDKICDITYARIQGKAAMLKRFENSALMEKDDEYKPLVFVSDGPNKGQRLPFPGPSSAVAASVQTGRGGALE